MVEFEGTEWKGWTEDFDKTKCHHEVRSYDYNTRKYYTSEKCTDPAVCMVFDHHEYYLGCFCSKHRPPAGTNG